jgi:hypothetical protein
MSQSNEDAITMMSEADACKFIVVVGPDGHYWTVRRFPANATEAIERWMARAKEVYPEDENFKVSIEDEDPIDPGEYR